MADEITLNATLQIRNGTHRDELKPGPTRADQTTQGSDKSVHTVTTGDTAISLGTVTTAGYVMFRNLDDTNFVDIGPENTGAIEPMIQLDPLKTAGPFKLKSTATMRWQADTASVKVEAIILEL